MPNLGGKIFPYAITLRQDGVLETVPVADVRVKNNEREEISLLCIIDSGAHISLLPEEDLLMLHAVSKNGTPLLIRGVTDTPMRSVVRMVPVSIGGVPLRIPVAFAKSPCPRVLGRKGVFEKFTVIFEESMNRAAFMRSGTKTSQIVRKAVDSLSS